MKNNSIIIFLCVSLLSCILSYGQVAAPTNTTGSSNLNMNWVNNRYYDETGAVSGETKQFYDNNGQLIQSQNKVKYRKDPSTTYTHVFATQPVRDAYGRFVLNTMAAPIDASEFQFKSDFMQNSSSAVYDYRNFDRFNPSGTETDKTYSPDPIGNKTTKGTLGWYYSLNNTWEPYTPTTDYPFGRSVFYKDGTNNLMKSGGTGEIFKMGSGHEGRTFITPVAGELADYLRIRNKYFSTSDVGAVPTDMQNQGMQLISRDANGKEAILIKGKDGNVLMAARPGTDLTASNTVVLPVAYTFNFKGISIGNNATNLKVNSPTAGNIKIYESQDAGATYSQIYSGAASSYSSSGALSYYYRVESDAMFTVSYDADMGSSVLKTICSSCSAIPNGNSTTYFKLFAAGTVTVTGGTFTLYDIDTDLPVSFTSGNTLAAGYYKLVNTTIGSITLGYSNGYTDVSYSFYNQLGQLVATVAPEGIKLLYGTGINNYATKDDIPFASLCEYNVRGRLVKTTTSDAGVTEFVYRSDGKIRFSQNAEQSTTGRFSYITYDQYGRLIESGEYQPDGSGIVFNSNMNATTNAMRDILENTTGTGGLTTGTKRDILQTVFDVPDATHGLTGYTQDPIYINGGISVTKKYTTIVNNTPNSSNLVSATWYNYNGVGEIIWRVQMIQNAGGGNLYKTTDYTFDLRGRLVKSIFQKNTSGETFVHYYEYDPFTNRLWKLYTNTTDNSGTKKLQSTYIYYLHGPLKRVELAGSLQGIDYTYTLQGALKAINNSDKTKDPGDDGSNGISADAYGMVLNYYTDDYKNNRSTGIQPIKSVDASAITTDSYTGNVQAMTWFSKKPTLSGVTDDAVTYVYKYNDKYEFTESVWGTGINFSNTPASFTATNNNKETILDPTSGLPAYDAHGNILRLQRTNTAGTQVDKFTYNYVTNTNKLQSVVNNATGSPVTYADYTYNSKGQVTLENTGDPAKKKYIRYDATGKVVAVARDASFTNLVAEFVYNETGQRIIKKSYNLSYQLAEITYYTGNAIFTQSVTSGSTFGSVVPQEYEIEGGVNGRSGVYYKQAGVYAYELNDHLGNVRAVIAADVSGYTVKTYSDYYPYGLTIQSGGDSYRYGYQGKYAEKDGETDWNAFELRMYDSRIGRWLSTDPEGQFVSPYIGMGNDPVNGIDPDGGFRFKALAWLWKKLNEPDGTISRAGSGDRKWVVAYTRTDRPNEVTYAHEWKGNGRRQVFDNWWNHKLARDLVPDMLSINGSFSFGPFVQWDNEVSLTWLTRGKDRSIYPYFTHATGVTLSTSAALEVGVNTGSGYFLSSYPEDWTAEQLAGPQIAIGGSVGFNEGPEIGIWGEYEAGYEKKNGKYRLTTLMEKKGMVVGISEGVPIIGAHITLSTTTDDPYHVTPSNLIRSFKRKRY